MYLFISSSFFTPLYHIITYFLGMYTYIPKNYIYYIVAYFFSGFFGACQKKNYALF